MDLAWTQEAAPKWVQSKEYKIQRLRRGMMYTQKRDILQSQLKLVQQTEFWRSYMPLPSCSQIKYYYSHVLYFCIIFRIITQKKRERKYAKDIANKIFTKKHDICILLPIYKQKQNTYFRDKSTYAAKRLKGFSNFIIYHSHIFNKIHIL